MFLLAQPSLQNTGSAWNRTNWAKPWGKESNTVAEDFFRQENNAANGKVEKLVGNVTGKTPGIKQPQPPVSFKIIWQFVLHLVIL